MQYFIWMFMYLKVSNYVDSVGKNRNQISRFFVQIPIPVYKHCDTQWSCAVLLEVDINTQCFYTFVNFEAVNEIAPVREMDLKTIKVDIKLIKQSKSQTNVKKTFSCSHLTLSKISRTFIELKNLENSFYFDILRAPSAH